MIASSKAIGNMMGAIKRGARLDARKKRRLLDTEGRPILTSGGKVACLAVPFSVSPYSPFQIGNCSFEVARNGDLRLCKGRIPNSWLVDLSLEVQQ